MVSNVIAKDLTCETARAVCFISGNGYALLRAVESIGRSSSSLRYKASMKCRRTEQGLLRGDNTLQIHMCGTRDHAGGASSSNQLRALERQAGSDCCVHVDCENPCATPWCHTSFAAHVPLFKLPLV